MAEKDEGKIQIRNSTNDFLVFTKENGGDGVDVLVADENVWLTQGGIVSLYDSSKSNISEHLTNIFASGELDEDSVVRKFRTTAADGKLYAYKYYNLQAIIAVGFKVNSDSAVRFRAWAADVLADFAMKGYVLDKERLKNDRVFSTTYFEQLLEDIREIRLSERKLYQKITDIYATAFDYDSKSKETELFFKTVQNKLHYAIHGHTAAEIIVERANAEKEHMGLTTWENHWNRGVMTMLFEYSLQTPKQDFYNITARVREAVAKSGVTNGIAVVCCPHTTAGITINENADPDVVRDLLFGLFKAFPDRAEFRHAEGNSSAHLKASAMGSSVTVVIDGGKLVLGIWQGVYFCEFDPPRNRKFYVKVIAG